MSGEELSKTEVIDQEKNLLTAFKGHAIKGLIVFSPLLATFLVFKWFLGIFQIIPSGSFFQISAFPLLNQVFKAGILTGAAGIIVIGLGRFMSTRQGTRVEQKVDTAFSKLPVIGTVYSITKAASDTVFRNREEFKQPVKLSYQGLKLTAFRTGEGREEGKTTVFVPTSPNITSGFVVEVDENQLEETDDSLEQAFTRVLSAGFSS